MSKYICLTYKCVNIFEKLPIRDNTWNSKEFTLHNSLHDSNEYCVSAVFRLLLKKSLIRSRPREWLSLTGFKLFYTQIDVLGDLFVKT